MPNQSETLSLAVFKNTDLVYGLTYQTAILTSRSVANKILQVKNNMLNPAAVGRAFTWFGNMWVHCFHIIQSM